MFARTTVALVALAGFAAASMAGPLTPPSGPVTSTGKTLTEVEPRIAINATNTPGDADSVFKIIGPGNYYLTSNVLGQFAKHGIEIAATVTGTVTIDLNGYQMVGGPDSQSGIARSNAIPVRIVLKNGTVRNWEGSGVNLPNIEGGTFEDVKFVNNIGAGLVTTHSRIINCEASSNTGHGMSVEDGSVIEGCVARLNGQSGIYADHDGTIHNCEVSNNTLNGILVEYQGLVTNSSATSNGNIGIYLPRGGTADTCVATSNAQGGFRAMAGILRACVANDNMNYGLSGGWTVFEECNAMDNNGVGFDGGGASTIRRCLATSNSSHGISAGGAMQILDCQTQYNGGDGIRCSLDGNTIRGNSCISDGALSGDGAGIHVMTTDSVIEGNRVTDADRGIDIDGPGNTITGNKCSGNTMNWSFVAGNYYGPIIDRTGVAATGVSGNAAASTLGTTDPHANFTY